MSSYEERFYLENPTLVARLRRDLELIGWLFGHAVAWFVPGWRLRRAYREAEQTGRVVHLEDHLGDENV